MTKLRAHGFLPEDGAPRRDVALPQLSELMLPEVQRGGKGYFLADQDT
jgi:hypothetical protein